MRRLLLSAFLPLAFAGCGKAPPPPAHGRRMARALPAPPAPSQPASPKASGRPADILRLYYRRIESGDYRAAWRMRSGGKIDEARFAANFKAYRDYHAMVGLASLPAAGGEWVYVEVPVMITGRLVTGKPFGSAGSVTLRRPARGGGWTIYPG
jgi:hypothetical protein